MRRPEILAPAGDRDALAAALAAGADAVYFGLDDGFNARARAANFPSDGLAEVVAWVHRAGARAYVALNTLVFESELAVVEQLIRRVAAAGADAVIAQDPAVALIVRAACPALEVHASTQMTASSPLAVELLRELGLARVVVPRELSIDEIRAYAAGTTLPLEVFIHGALCIAWSGQCLSSEAWGGRSANRGQCAQACRLPYQLVVDGEVRPLGEVEYLLSPKDLVGLDAVPALAEIGVASLKIEGRLKGPHYVATAVAQYRRAAAAAAGEPPLELPVELPTDEAALHVAYSRGVSRGFLDGADHQTLVEGRFPRHRGVALGRVIQIERSGCGAPAAASGDLDAVIVVPDPAQRPTTGGLALAGRRETPVTGGSTSTTPSLVPRAGMGVAFDRGRPETTEQGGPIFAVEPVEAAGGAHGYRLAFGRPGPDLDQVAVGDFVWVTSDPRVIRAGDKAVAAGREAATGLGRIPIAVSVRGGDGLPLEASATIARRPAIGEIRVCSRSALAPARGGGLSRALLADKLGGLGGTPFHLGSLDTTGLGDGLHLPVSELKQLRRALVAALDAALVRVEPPRAATDAAATRSCRPPSGSMRAPDQPRARSARGRSIQPLANGTAGAPSTSVLDALRATHAASAVDRDPVVVPMCRTDAQLDAVLDAGAREVELDWMELVGLARAVERARRRGARVGVATVRVQKPGEHRIDAHLARLAPDHVVVRSWGSLAFFRGLGGPALHGDFSLNVTNSIAAGWVFGHGVETITAAHDLDRTQLVALLDQAPRGRIGVTLHHHIPTFHTEHCVYAHLLSSGRDFRSCGRPCERHELALRDRVGLIHPVVVDVGCRNTVFNAQAQSAATLFSELRARGVWRFRVELVRESAAEATTVFGAYRDLIAGSLGAAEVVRRTAVHEQFGVTRGTMRTLTVVR